MMSENEVIYKLQVNLMWYFPLFSAEISIIFIHHAIVSGIYDFHLKFSLKIKNLLIIYLHYNVQNIYQIIWTPTNKNLACF